MTKPPGVALPPPKKNFSISSSRNLRDFGSIGESRCSLMRMVWCFSHSCQASFETWSKMRWPSSPG